MKWWETILRFFGIIGEAVNQVAQNKSLKIPLQADAIKAEAEKDAQRKRSKIHRRTKQQDKNIWQARLELFELKFRTRRRAKHDINSLIDSGAEIINIQKTNESVMINFKRDGKEDFVIV